MMLTSEGIMNILRRNTEKKIESGVFSNYRNDYLLKLLFSCVVLEILLSLFRFPIIIFYIGLLIILMVYCFFVFKTRACFGFTDESYLFVRFKIFSNKEDKIEEILFDKIKYFAYHKFLFTNYLTISYLDNKGKFSRLRISYRDFVLGFGLSDQKKYSSILNKFVLEMQKKLDKGDF